MKKQYWTLLIISLILGGLLSYFASSHPDGLERVAEDMGFIEKAAEPGFEVIPDYQVPNLPPFWANFFAGVIGTLVVWVLTLGLLQIYRKRNIK
jgi:hypothetical protein